MTPTLDAPELPTTDPADEQAEEAYGAQDYGPNNKDLPEQLVDVVRACIVEFQNQDKFTRRREVLHDRRNRYYERGYQHLNWNNSTGMFTLATPGGTITTQNGQEVQLPSYIDDYNIFHPNARILTSVLTQSLPGVDFQPTDPSISEDIDKAAAAEGYTKLYDRMNDVNQIQTEIVRMMLLSGRTVTWTRTEEDGPKFGYMPDGTPRTFETTTVYGTLENKVPLLAKAFDKDFLYCILYDDPDVKVAKNDVMKYAPEFAKKIKGGTSGLGESAYERIARLGIMNGTRSMAQIGDSMSHLVTRTNCFIRAASFTGAAFDAPVDAPGQGDVGEDGGTMTVREKLLQLFPDGARFQFIGDTYVGSWAESMDDHLDIQFPFDGDGMFRMAYMDPGVVVQDWFNDIMNWLREKIDTGAGSLWINAEDSDLDAIRSQRAAPNAIRGFKGKGSGIAQQDHFYKEPDPEIPASLMQIVEFLQGPLVQFMLATVPSIWGESAENIKTASGQAMASASAKGQLGLVWARIQRMFARIRYQAALAASRNPQHSDTVVVPGNGGPNQTVNMEALRKGSFGCYPDEDSSFPESTAMKRATMNNLITLAGQSPMLMELLNNPDNIEELKRLNGFQELTMLPAVARDKQVFEIEILLAGAPVPPDPMLAQEAQIQHATAALQAEQQGLPEPPFTPPQPTSSVPVDELDYHQWEFDKCQEWLSSPARRTEEAKGNALGIQNVQLHAMEHKAFLMAAMPPALPTLAPHAGPPAPPPQVPRAPVGAPPDVTPQTVPAV